MHSQDCLDPRGDTRVSEGQRRQLLRQRPITVWLTGLSGSGKSTMAFALEKALFAQGRSCYVLDGDEIRTGISSDLGFSESDRRENIRRVAHVARLMNDAGLIVIAALISPITSDRSLAREIIGNQRFIETFVSADLLTCEGRDTKGLYAKARAGLIPSFTGVTAPYEAPANPELCIDTAAHGIMECTLRIVDFVSLKTTTVASTDT